MTIVNYASSIIDKLKALLTDDARVVIYYRHVFIGQATGLTCLDEVGICKQFTTTLEPLI